MQNKGLIRLFAIILSVVCLYQLSFTWVAKNIENDAVIYAESNADATSQEALNSLEREYLDSVANTPVMDLGHKKAVTRTIWNCSLRPLKLPATVRLN